MFVRLWRYWNTLRHLRFVQIRHQVWRRVPSCVRRDRVRGQPSAPALRTSSGTWVPPVSKPTSWLGAGRFRFLNKTWDRGSEAAWDAPWGDRLWSYNLHYFDYLGQTAPPGPDVLDEWIVANPPGSAIAWDAYPLSLRVVNWVKRHYAGAALSAQQCSSLARQLHWLTHNLEYHLLGNHLWANGKALVFGGLFFSGATADRWQREGLAILRSQLREQILPDGGHFERSPMYHAIVLEDVLDLVNILRLYGVLPELRADLQATAAGMLDWMRVVCHPDGQIPFFNDSALGIAAAPSELAEYARRLDVHPPMASSYVAASALLRESGYARMSHAPFDLLADVGSISPPYQPGHAHAEALSFELSAFGSRCLVNAGVSTYRAGADRAYQRSSEAHNCLVIDEQNSSEVWASHRVARRANVRVSEASARRLAAGHDGYSRLSGVGDHIRTWSFEGTGLTVSDRLGGTGRHRVALYFHVHPDWQVASSDGEGIWLRRGEHWMRLAVSTLDVSLVGSSYFPEFGKAVDTRTIVARGDVDLPFAVSTTIHGG